MAGKQSCRARCCLRRGLWPGVCVSLALEGGRRCLHTFRNKMCTWRRATQIYSAKDTVCKERKLQKNTGTLLLQSKGHSVDLGDVHVLPPRQTSRAGGPRHLGVEAWVVVPLCALA